MASDAKCLPAPAPSAACPDGWRPAVWDALVRGLCSDANTFLAAGPLQSEEEDPEVLDGDWVGTAHAALASDPHLANVRFGLVPKWVDENRFWFRYLRKISILGRTSCVREAREELCVLNRDPGAEGAGRRRNRGLPDWSRAAAEAALAPAAAAEAEYDWSRGFTAEAEADAAAAREAAKELHTVLSRRGVHRGDLELLQRVYARCRDLKQELARRVAEAESAPDPALVRCTVPKLLEANAQLRAALSLCHRAGLATDEGPVLCLAALRDVMRRESGSPQSDAADATEEEEGEEGEEEEEEEEEDEEGEEEDGDESSADRSVAPSWLLRAPSFPHAPSTCDYGHLQTPGPYSPIPGPGPAAGGFASLAVGRGEGRLDARSPSIYSTGSAGAALWYAEMLPRDQHWRAEYAGCSAPILQAVGRAYRARRLVSVLFLERGLRTHMRRHRGLLRGSAGMEPEQKVRMLLRTLQRVGRGFAARRSVVGARPVTPGQLRLPPGSPNTTPRLLPVAGGIRRPIPVPAKASPGLQPQTAAVSPPVAALPPSAAA
eukprot:TRINITY_DN11921_c0_g1_i1.p1 TRINITY_DN11921_c0_g1~~TRINITY_DN11921_c0_g1_i1.p1  ORF type:complete len:617 (+),score=123.40 TRINITY_DN11921_c0_g1_i1:212-1852(+)